MSENIIEIKKMSKNYGSGKGIFDITLNIPKGKVFGLLGRNGAGKTTLLKSLVGLIIPETGTCEIMGLDFIDKNYEILKKTGYVDEHKNLYDWMSVKEIIEFTANFYETWDDEYVESMLNEFKIPKNQKIGNLSKGERAEISLLLSLGFSPELLILDEPASGLDIIVRDEFLDKFIQFACKSGTSIVISSHILEDVERMCDEVAFIEAGRVLYQTEMENLRIQYKKYLLENDSQNINFTLISQNI
jgi:ABC-2 type transport system ATP-binding protein